MFDISHGVSTSTVSLRGPGVEESGVTNWGVDTPVTLPFRPGSLEGGDGRISSVGVPGTSAQALGQRFSGEENLASAKVVV